MSETNISTTVETAIFPFNRNHVLPDILFNLLHFFSTFGYFLSNTLQKEDRATSVLLRGESRLFFHFTRHHPIGAYMERSLPNSSFFIYFTL